MNTIQTYLRNAHSYILNFGQKNLDLDRLKEYDWKYAALLTSGVTSIITLPPLMYIVAGTIMSRRRRVKIYSNVLQDHSSSATKKKLGEMRKDSNVLIVGAGVIGCALAAVLAQREPNWTITVIERDLTQPDRIIGELLQPGGLNMLKTLGLSHCVEGIDASIVEGYGVFLRDNNLKMQYPADATGQNPTGRGLHYGRFIQKLRDNLSQYPNISLLNGSVTKLLEMDGVNYGVQYKTTSGELVSITASLTMIATGAGSIFSKKVNNAKSLSRSTFVGVRVKGGNNVLPYPHHGNVFMMYPGPVLAYPTSSEDVRILVDFPNGTMPPRDQMSQYLLEKIAPQFPTDTIRNAFIDAVKEGDIRSVPNREMPAERSRIPGVLLLGDALSQRHPLTGSGMTAGLTDVYHLSNAITSANLDNYSEVQKRLDQWWNNRNSSIATINILANALYAVFTPTVTPDPYVGLLQDAVFNYFQTGGICVTGPVSLLGGLIKSPYVLTFHYFGVAFYTIKAAFNPLPTPWSVYSTYRAIKCAVGIVFPLLAEERIFRAFIPTGFFNRDALRYSSNPSS